MCARLIGASYLLVTCSLDLDGRSLFIQHGFFRNGRSLSDCSIADEYSEVVGEPRSDYTNQHDQTQRSMEVYEWVQEVLANLELIVDSCVLLSSIEGGEKTM